MINLRVQVKFVLKGIIFDFDGVIAESVQIKTGAFVALYAPYGPDIIKKVVDHHEANGGMSRFKKIKLYHKSYLNKIITDREITELANQFSKMVINKVIASPYVPGALEFIQSSYKKYKLFISSGTPTDEINKILIARKISGYFTEVYGSPELKKDHVADICKKNNLQSYEIIFFGDAIEDIEAAAYHEVQFVLRIHKFNNSYYDLSHHTIIENFHDTKKLQSIINDFK